MLLGMQKEISELGQALSEQTEFYQAKDGPPCVDMNVEDKGFHEWFTSVWVSNLPVEPSADGLVRPWLENAKLGLQWREVGPERPSKGRELVNRPLALTLNYKTTFTRAEFVVFNIKHPKRDDFIGVMKEGHKLYFKIDTRQRPPPRP